MITDLLDQIQRLDQEATKGPWIDEDNALREILYHQRNELGGYAGSASLAEVLTNDDDAEFIALARTALPQLAKALRAVLWLHRPVEDRIHHGGMVCSHLRCTDEYHHDQSAYPCDTVRALTDAMEGDDEA